MSARARRLLGHIVRPGAVLVSVGLVSAFLGIGRSAAPSPDMVLIAGTNFTVTSTISDSPSVQTPALLYPAAPRYLWYTVQNPLTVPITVSSLSTAADPAFPVPPGCPMSNLDLSQTAFSGSLVVPSGGTNRVSVPISLRDTNVNQDACKSVTFRFLYSGTATYTQLFATTTNLASSLNPSIIGQPVTFTATVTPTAVPPSGPTGTVNFVKCASAACSSTTSLGTGSVQPNGQAVFTTSGLALGTTVVRATYAGDGSNFSASTSNTVSQVVNSYATTLGLTSSLNPSIYGQAVTFTATATSTAGTPSGPVTFFDGSASIGTSNLDATGKATLVTSALTPGTHPVKAVYAGNGTFFTSTSGVISQVVNYTSCISGTVNGGLTVTNGQWICVSSTGRVNGSVTVQSGGTLTILGGTLNGTLTVKAGGALVTAGGSISAIVATGAKTLRVCGVSISGDLSASGTPTFVLIGDGGDDASPSCGANTISGNVTVTNNTAGFEVGGNTISGSLTATGNTGAGPNPEDTNPEIEGNQIKGSLNCSGNNPAPINDGKPNTVKASRTGQCSATGF